VVLCKREESAHMGLFHFWARGPPRPPASLYTGLPEKRRLKPSGRWSWCFRPLFVVFRASQRVGQKIPCYQVQAHDGIGCLRTGNELPANALTMMKDASWFRLSGLFLRFGTEQEQ
jgi:hypothetical protein